MSTQEFLLRDEEKNRRKARTISALVHILLLILMFLPLLHYPDPPPGQEGILVNLGLPDIGQGDDNAAPAEQQEAVEEETPQPQEPQPEPEPEPQPEPPRPQPEPEPEPPKPAVHTEDPEAIALKKKKEEEARRKREEEARRRREEEERRRREEEARRRREEEARKLAEKKSQFGGLFEGGSGEGKGNTGKPGDQGDPNGDPSSDKLSGVSTGSGTVGGGLSDRGVVARPPITEKTQKAGRVVIKVCVDERGRVVEAEYTQRNSTTNDPTLINIALRNARKWRFSPAQVSKQCGTITYVFKLK